MSSQAIQLNFSLRTSANVRTVHLLGSWDGYKNQLPLSASKDADAKPGSWKGTFRFQGSHALKLGSRYWYYYIVDGYHVSHDPAKEHCVEKTTGRKLNILDVPAGKSSSSTKTTKKPAPVDVRRNSREIPQGRPLSPGRIQCPKPQKPYASRGLREADYDHSPIEELESQLAGTRLSDRPSYTSSPSDLSSAGSSSSGSFFSSCSDSSDEDERPVCRCNRVGVTRDGRRVKLDCGGRLCGNDSDSSESESEDEQPSRSRARVSPRSELQQQKQTQASRRVVAARR